MTDEHELEYQAAGLLRQRERAMRQLATSGHSSPRARAAINDYFEQQLEHLITELSAELGYADAVYQTHTGGRK